jgi:hypothetical protein
MTLAVSLSYQLGACKWRIEVFWRPEVGREEALIPLHMDWSITSWLTCSMVSEFQKERERERDRERDREKQAHTILLFWSKLVSKVSYRHNFYYTWFARCKSQSYPHSKEREFSSTSRWENWCRICQRALKLLSFHETLSPPSFVVALNMPEPSPGVWDRARQVR